MVNDGFRDLLNVYYILVLLIIMRVLCKMPVYCQQTCCGRIMAAIGPRQAV